jgi:two-component system, chemotaxis family, chemotaxis protein CheY
MLWGMVCMSTRILIADDNESTRTAMRHVLEGLGRWEIIEAVNGMEAVERAQEFRPQLIILDLAMPVMDGLTASREIAKILPGTPVLLHTLHSSTQVELEAGKSGVLKIVPKSEASALLSAVQEALHAKPLGSGTAYEAGSPEKAGLRRTEDRIRGLSIQLLTTKDDKIVEATLLELRDVLHRHIENFRTRLGQYPVVQERRARSAIAAWDAPRPEIA